MSHSAYATQETRRAGAPRAARHGAGFWMIGGVFAAAMAFSTVPTPLYPLYQARDHFSTFTVTVVFAVYAVGVLVSLLLAGHVSDWVGRRRVLLASLALELLAAVVFLAAPALPGLIAARVLTGLGVGMLTATATAHLQELHAVHRPGASAQRFETVATVANIGGLGLGALAAGLLAQFVRAPLVVPYLAFVVLLPAGAGAVLLTPETVPEPPTRPAYRPQRISTRHGGPASYLAASAAGFVAFALFGLFTSLAPGFVAGTLHHPSRALAGLVVSAVFGASALAQTLSGRLSEPARRRTGLASTAGGVLLLTVSVQIASLAGFLIAGIASGAGAGLLFRSAVGTVAGMARPEKRGEALAGLFVIAYLGLVVPPVALGVATRYTTAATALTWFSAVQLALLAAVAVLARRAATGRATSSEPERAE
jgi:MFS family permease